ncbi:uncharacterized protein LOC123682066 [Harmonia axyridis]|uniref:uncharacterized protein LOC123682066 n=1 Tax=Harmonia axyridis TaxID=115357 RepID=UPI001E278302|nr:uncharacterized protein LOC123682066 [Harmonia axyridis]
MTFSLLFPKTGLLRLWQFSITTTHTLSLLQKKKLKMVSHSLTPKLSDVQNNGYPRMFLNRCLHSLSSNQIDEVPQIRTSTSVDPATHDKYASLPLIPPLTAKLKIRSTPCLDLTWFIAFHVRTVSLCMLDRHHNV